VLEVGELCGELGRDSRARCGRSGGCGVVARDLGSDRVQEANGQQELAQGHETGCSTHPEQVLKGL